MPASLQMILAVIPEVCHTKILKIVVATSVACDGQPTAEAIATNDRFTPAPLREVPTFLKKRALCYKVRLY
jgi:hypothetical protein